MKQYASYRPSPALCLRICTSIYLDVYLCACVCMCVCVCASRALVTGGSVRERLPLLVKDTIDRGRPRRW